jgi:hypothetical protein
LRAAGSGFVFEFQNTIKNQRRCLVEKVAEVLNKVVGSSGWCEVGPECAACGGCSLALLFPVDPQLSLHISDHEENTD